MGKLIAIVLLCFCFCSCDLSNKKKAKIFVNKAISEISNRDYKSARQHCSSAIAIDQNLAYGYYYRAVAKYFLQDQSNR